MSRIEHAAERLDLRLPKAFHPFFEDDRFRFRINSSDEFGLPDTMLKKIKVIPRGRKGENGARRPSGTEGRSTGNDERPGNEDAVTGYIIKFLEDQQGSGPFIHLYLDAGDSTSGPGHCGLSSSFDPNVYYIGGSEERSMTGPQVDERIKGRQSAEIDEEIKKHGREIETCVGADKVKIKVNELEQELGVWPADGGLDANLETTDFEEFLAKNYFNGLSIAVAEAKDGKIPKPFKQHLIDVYSTKGSKYSS